MCHSIRYIVINISSIVITIIFYVITKHVITMYIRPTSDTLACGLPLW